MIPASVTLKGIWAAIIAAAFAIVLALLVVQTIRIDGFRFLFLRHTGLAEQVADYEAAEKAAQAAYEAETTRRATIGTAYEREASNAAQIATVREREIRTIYRDIEVPADCAVPDDAYRVLSEAIAAANAAAAGEPVGPLPTATDTPGPAD